MSLASNTVPECTALSQAKETNNDLIVTCQQKTTINLMHLQSIPSKPEILEICRQCPDLIKVYSKVKCPNNMEFNYISIMVENVCSKDLVETSKPTPRPPVSPQTSHSNSLQILKLTTITALLFLCATTV